MLVNGMSADVNGGSSLMDVVDENAMRFLRCAAGFPSNSAAGPRWG